MRAKRGVCMSDRELLEQVLNRMGDVDRKLKIAQSRLGTEENLVSAWKDVAGLEVMISDHLKRTESGTAE
jgi:hypothetical protein